MFVVFSSSCLLFVAFALLWKFFTFNASLIAQQSHRAVKNGSSYGNIINNSDNDNNNNVEVGKIVAKLCNCSKLKAFIGATRRRCSGHGPVVAVCQPYKNNNNYNNKMLSMWQKRSNAIKVRQEVCRQLLPHNPSAWLRNNSPVLPRRSASLSAVLQLLTHFAWMCSIHLVLAFFLLLSFQSAPLDHRPWPHTIGV